MQNSIRPKGGVAKFKADPVMQEVLAEAIKKHGASMTALFPPVFPWKSDSIDDSPTPSKIPGHDDDEVHGHDDDDDDDNNETKEE